MKTLESRHERTASKTGTAPARQALDRGREGIRQAGNLAMQQLLDSGVVQARRTQDGGDPEERQADSMARRALRPGGAGASGGRPAGPAAGSIPDTGRDPSTLRSELFGSARGAPLPASDRSRFEAGFGSDFSQVRLYTRGAGAAAAQAMGAQAFTYRNHIAFAPGRYDPRSAGGRSLLAHELAHVVQQRQAGAPKIQRLDEPETVSEATLQASIDQLAAAVREGDLDTAVGLLRNRSGAQLTTLREAVHRQTDIWLERWFVRQAGVADALTLLGDAASVAGLLMPGGSLTGVSGLLMRADSGGETGAAEEGLRLLWRILPLLDRLEIYTEYGRELEQAQLDVIRSASREERDAALLGRPRLNVIYAGMNPEEEYQARLLMEPAERYTAVVQLISRRCSTLSLG